MKILHFSDLHLDTPFAAGYMPSRVARGCRVRLRQTLVRILDLAVEQEVDAVTIAGDLFEGDRVRRDTLQFLHESFSQIAPIPVFIAPGNHDYFSPVSPYSRFDWPENVYIFNDSRLRPAALAEDVHLWGFAHTLPNMRTNPFREFTAQPAEALHLVLLHGSELGAFTEERGQYAPFRIEDMRGAGFRYGLFGHFHGGRTLKDGETEIGIYPGSPQPLSFGETGTHAAALLHIDGGEIKSEWIPTATQSFLTLDFQPAAISDTHTLAEAILQKVSSKAPEANFLRVNLTGEMPEGLSLQLELLQEHLHQYFDFVLVNNRLQERRQLPPADDRTVRGRFVRRMQEMLEQETEDPELVELALHLGLEAFEEKDLSGL